LEKNGTSQRKMLQEHLFVKAKGAAALQENANLTTM